jgi:ubiquinone/menaquinone biosynthesis C-methylase UbiE
MDYKPKTYWESEDFESAYQMGKQPHRVYLLNLLKNKGVVSILDVGCGTGPIYELNEEYGFKYKGTDYSRTMINTCKRLFPAGNFEVEDARHMTEKDNSWDCVLLMHCLDHLDNYQAAIAEAKRVASKYVCIVLWRGFVDGGTRLNPRNTYGKQEGEEPWEDTYLQDYSREVLEEEFNKNDLKVVQTAEGNDLNGDYSHYNFLFLLEKNDKTE